MFYKKFVFGKTIFKDINESDLVSGKIVCMTSADLYEPGKGYGFVTEENQHHVLPGHFQKISEDEAMADAAFSPDVFDSSESTSVFTCSMMGNVCDIIPRGQTKPYEDTTLDLTILADRPRISELVVEEVDCTTFYIAGDSTVTDQSADYPYAPGASYAGWGQMLSAYLTDDVAVSNHAHSGLTTESFREEGHWAIVENYMRAACALGLLSYKGEDKLSRVITRGEAARLCQRMRV